MGVYLYKKQNIFSEKQKGIRDGLPYSTPHKSEETRVFLITGLDCWNGLLDWTTGLYYWTHLNCYKMPSSVYHKSSLSLLLS